MSEREPRKRIPLNKAKLLPVEDPAAYIQNKCSERARKVNTIQPNFNFNIWFDQHYQHRTQFGDDNGKREGIDSERVQSLVNKAMDHLVTYSTFLKTFAFVNHVQTSGRNERVVLQEETQHGLLNVVIEVHLIEVGIYEVTVKTAMCIKDFAISDGQYVLQLIDNESILKRKERGVLREICSL